MEKVFFLGFLLFFLVYAQKDYTECDEYLRKYGYVFPGQPFNRTEALRAFQRFAGLPRTGMYDDATKMKMRERRCGCLDIMHNRTAPGGAEGRRKRNARGPQGFNAGRFRWSRTALTWRLITPLQNSRLSVEEQRDAFRRAFDLWAQQTPLTFSERRSSTADINIVFAGRTHRIGRGDEGFDGQGRVLAHAFFPEDGRAHFDEEERWVINSNDGIELFIVAAHEFGHNLGLGHSEVQSALMAPFYAGFTENFQLDRDDIAGIQTLYGGPTTATPAPPTSRRTTLRPTQPTPATTSATRNFVCDIPFTAVMSDFSGDLLAFIGSRSFLKIRFGTGLLYGPAPSQFAFRRPIRRPDAAFNIQTTGEFFFVKGIRLFRYDAVGQRNGRPAWILGGTSSMPERPHAALAISRNDIYMFGATQVWKWNAFRDEVIPGSHSYINEEFPGIPDMPDAALAFNSSLAYFFKGTTFITYDLTNRRVISGPADTGSFFMGNICGNPN